MSPPAATRKSRPSSDLLASPALTRLVTHYALHPGANLHFHALKRATGLPNRSLQIELRRLEHLGLIERRPDGQLVRYLTLDNQPRWTVLRDVVRQFVDPLEVLRIALTQVVDLTAAFVYGSFARERDIRPASDIDLFVVFEGVAESRFRTSLATEVLEVSGFLGREVNVTRYSRRQIEERALAHSRFVASVMAGPKKWLVGSPARLTHVFRILHAQSQPSVRT